VTDRTPIPPAEFADAVDQLDRDALTRFVARLEAAAGDVAVDVDPPTVIVGEGDARQTIVVAPDGDASGAIETAATDADIDTVVAGTESIDAGNDRELSIRTPADLRRQLLYALPPDAAESVAEEYLGVPARVARDVANPAPDDSDTLGNAEVGPTPEPPAADLEPGSTPTGETQPVGAPTGKTQAAGTPAGEKTSDRPTASTGSELSDSPVDTGATGRPSAQIAVVGVLVVVLLAVTGGVVYAAAVSPTGDAGAFASSTGPGHNTVAAPAVDDDGLSMAANRNQSRGPIDHGGPVDTPTTSTPDEGVTAGGGPQRGIADAANRNVRPAPTCDRSSLLVVQIQLNALKYNNNTTNDGIRTVRRFSSPRNRQAIETFDEFVRTIQSPTYNPLLSYESVEYTPIQVSDDYAQVQVVTRKDDTVTGQYFFRLQQVDGGQYDGCWMTDAVIRSPPTANTSEGVVAHPEGIPVSA
jgi:hypothetical protein